LVGTTLPPPFFAIAFALTASFHPSSDFLKNAARICPAPVNGLLSSAVRSRSILVIGGSPTSPWKYLTALSCVGNSSPFVACWKCSCTRAEK